MTVDFQSFLVLVKNYILKPQRILNAGLIYISYQLTKILKRPIIWGAPITAMIEPTTACNLGCPHCPSGLNQFTRPTGRISKELFEKIIDQIHNSVGYLTLYFQGEPYLNPQFTELVELANKKRIYTATSSNAHFLNEKNAEKTVLSGLKKMIISIDGTTQETYAKYRLSGQLETVLNGTKNMILAKEKHNSNFPKIIWQFIVFQHNEHQLEDIKKLAEEYKVDKLSFKTAQIYDYANASEWLPENEEFSRYKETETGLKIKNKLLNHCWRLWSSVVFTWDGSVVPCCFDKDAKYQMENIANQKFSEIWRNQNYNGFRQQLTKGRANIDICTNCSEGTKVWM